MNSSTNEQHCCKMALPNVGRCRLCNTNLCTLIIFFKWIFDCALFNFYSDSWEKNLPVRQRAEQRRKKNDIQFYRFITVTLAIVHFITTASKTSESCKRANISFVATIVYLFSFWYVTQGQEEYRVQSLAWHSGRRRGMWSKVCMTEHIKCIVTVISVVEVAALFTTNLKVLHHVAWFLVTILQFCSWYFFLDPNVRQLFPPEEDQHNELVYMIEP